MPQSGTIAIVGAGPGLGLAIGRAFGQRGHNVALIGRSGERAEGLAATLQGEGIEAAGFAGDTTDEASIAAAIAAVRDKFGAIDILEFSPSAPQTDPAALAAQATTAEAAEAHFRLQVLGAINAVRQVLPEMTARGSGTILLTTGLSATVPIPVITPIASAMAGCRQYALCLNAELADSGVFVGTISIGVFIGSGQPGSDASEIAEAYVRLAEARDTPEVQITAPDALKEGFGVDAG